MRTPARFGLRVGKSTVVTLASADPIRTTHQAYHLDVADGESGELSYVMLHIAERTRGFLNFFEEMHHGLQRSSIQ